MVLRNGEQLLLTVVIPVLVLTVFGSVEVMDLGDRAARVDFLVPGVLALAVMSTAFTGLAIGTGFERRYGALKRLGASPLPRGALLAAKALAVLTIEALQVALLVRRRASCWAGTRAGRGAAVAGAPARRHRRVQRARRCSWPARCGPRRPWPPPTWSTCCSWSAAASPCRWTGSPTRPSPFLEALPAGALSEGLREVLRDGAGAAAGGTSASSSCWAAVAGVLAARTFRWE